MPHFSLERNRGTKWSLSIIKAAIGLVGSEYENEPNIQKTNNLQEQYYNNAVGKNIYIILVINYDKNMLYMLTSLCLLDDLGAMHSEQDTIQISETISHLRHVK